MLTKKLSTFIEIAESNNLTPEEKELLLSERAKVDDSEGNKCQDFIDETAITNSKRD